MSETFRRIVDLVHRGEVRISAHGYGEIVEDGILAGEVIDGVGAAVVVEEYPTYPKGPPNSRSLGYPDRADVAGSLGYRLSTGSGSLD